MSHEESFEIINHYALCFIVNGSKVTPVTIEHRSQREIVGEAEEDNVLENRDRIAVLLCDVHEQFTPSEIMDHDETIFAQVTGLGLKGKFTARIHSSKAFEREEEHLCNDEQPDLLDRYPNAQYLRTKKRDDLTVSSMFINDVLVIEAKGSITIEGAALIEDFAHDAIKKRNAVILYFRNIEHIQSVGIGSLVALSRFLKKREIPLAVCELQGRVKTVFTSTSLEMLMKIYTTFEKALEAVQSGGEASHADGFGGLEHI